MPASADTDAELITRVDAAFGELKAEVAAIRADLDAMERR